MKLFNNTTEVSADGKIVTKVSNSFATFCKDLYNGSLTKGEVMEQLEEDPIIGDDYRGYVYETGWVTPSNDLNAAKQLLYDVAPLQLHSYTPETTMTLLIEYEAPVYSQGIQKKLVNGEWIFCEVLDTGYVKYIDEPEDTDGPIIAIRLTMPMIYAIGVHSYGAFTGHSYLVNKCTNENSHYEIELVTIDPTNTITENVSMLGRINSKQTTLFNTLSIPADLGSFAEMARREAVIAVTKNFVSR